MHDKRLETDPRLALGWAGNQTGFSTALHQSLAIYGELVEALLKKSRPMVEGLSYALSTFKKLTLFLGVF